MSGAWFSPAPLIAEGSFDCSLCTSHASATLTARYDRRGDMAKRKAVGVLHFPYWRRGECCGTASTATVPRASSVAESPGAVGRT